MGNLVVQHHQHAVSDIERMARAFATSKLFGVTNPEQAVALCLIAQAEGRHPASAAQDYHIISGRPSKKADAMLRDFLNNGGKVEWHTLDDDTADATFSHPAGGSVRISWDAERVKAAGINNPMHKKYPRQMLRARTVSEGVRTVFPMATSGMYVPEEVQEFDAPAAQPQTVQEPLQIEGEANQPSDNSRAVLAGFDSEIQAAGNAAMLQAIYVRIQDSDLSDEQVVELNDIINARLASLKTKAKAPPAKEADPFGFDQMEQSIPYGGEFPEQRA